MIWGISRFYFHGISRSLNSVAGGLLVMGGVSRGFFQAFSMDELTGAVANLIPVIAVFIELFASHYRKQK